MVMSSSRGGRPCPGGTQGPVDLEEEVLHFSGEAPRAALAEQRRAGEGRDHLLQVVPDVRERDLWRGRRRAQVLQARARFLVTSVLGSMRGPKPRNVEWSCSLVGRG